MAYEVGRNMNVSVKSSQLRSGNPKRSVYRVHVAFPPATQWRKTAVQTEWIGLSR